MQNYLTGGNKAGLPYLLYGMLFAAIFLAQALGACRKGTVQQGPQPDVLSQPLQLTHGNPKGEAASAIITASGGALTSKDGSIKIEVPAGAIDAATTFSIQEVENVLKNKAKAFRLLPDGLVFKKPVTLTYYYGGISMEGLNPDFLFLAYQDKEGYFYSANKTKGNRQQQTLSVETTHFSDWTFYAQYDLHFPDHQLVNGDLRLLEGEEAVIELKAAPLDKFDTEYAQIQLPQLHHALLAQKAIWDYAPKKGTMNSNPALASVVYKAPAKVNATERVYINITINGNLGTDNQGNKVQQMQIRQPVVISSEGYFTLTEDGVEMAATNFSGEYLQLLGSQLTASFSNGYTLGCYIYGVTGGFSYNFHGIVGGATLELSQNGKNGMIVFRPKQCNDANNEVFFSPGAFNMKSIALKKGEYFEGEFSVTLFGYGYCEKPGSKSLSGKFRFRKND